MLGRRGQVALCVVLLSSSVLGARVGEAQWTVVPVPAAVSFRGLSVAGDGTTWASGTRGTVVRSTDGGRTWAVDTIRNAVSLDLRDVEAIDASTAYAMVAGTDTARIYKTSDGGTTWTMQYDDTRKGVFLDAISFWDAQHGIAIGDPMNGRFFVLVTDDGGAHWRELPGPVALPNDGAFAASGTSLVVAPGGGAWFATGGAAVARVLHSSDYGRTWVASEVPIPTGTGGGIFSLAFRDSMHGVALGGDYRYPDSVRVNVASTSDGGRTWIAGDMAGVTRYISGAAYGRGGRLVAVGTRGAWASDDDGRTWRRMESPSVGASAGTGVARRMQGYNAVAATRDGFVAVGDGAAAVWIP